MECPHSGHCPRRNPEERTMTFKRVILGGAGAAALILGSILGPAMSAAAVPGPGDNLPGDPGPSPTDQTCLSLRAQLSEDQAQLRQWVNQLSIDQSRGLDTSLDENEIALLETAINQDGQLLHAYHC